MKSGACSGGHVFSGDRCPYCALDILEHGLRELIDEHRGSYAARKAQKILDAAKPRPSREIATLDRATDRLLNRLHRMEHPKLRWQRWVIDPVRRLGSAISCNSAIASLRDGLGIVLMALAILLILVLYSLTVVGLNISLRIKHALDARGPNLRVVRDFLADDGAWLVPLCAFLIALGVYSL